MNELLDHRTYKRALIAAFLVLSWAPLLGSLAGGDDDIALAEQRLPAELPSFPENRKAFRVLPIQVSAFLNDSFGFRSGLVTANSLLHLAIGMSGSERYLLGRDGWFFHRSDDHALEQFRGSETFGDGELNVWIAEMLRRKAWLERAGIDFLIVVAPSKLAIYPEYLPEWVNVVGPTRYSKLKARVHRMSLQVLDLHEPLRNAKGADPLYYKTDGHWNDLGAFVAYREIASWIRERHPQVRALARSDFSLTWETTGVGTITRGLNIMDFVPERVPRLTLRSPSHIVSTEELGSGPKFAAKYVERVRTDLHDRPRVLFIRDSFATPLARFVSETVSETVLTHHRLGEFDRDAIEQYQPDIVIYELIERGLRWKLRDPPVPEPSSGTASPMTPDEAARVDRGDHSADDLPL